MALLLISFFGRSKGPVALVLANSVAMLLRGLLGFSFAYKQLQPSWSEWPCLVSPAL